MLGQQGECLVCELSTRHRGDRQQLIRIFREPVETPAETVEPLERRGRDYARWRKAGKRAKTTIIRTMMFYASVGDAETAEAAYAAIKGTAVTVIDSHNSSYANCMVEDVTIVSKRAVIQAGSTKVRLAAEWTIRAGDPLA